MLVQYFVQSQNKGNSTLLVLYSAKSSKAFENFCKMSGNEFRLQSVHSDSGIGHLLWKGLADWWTFQYPEAFLNCSTLSGNVHWREKKWITKNKNFIYFQDYEDLLSPRPQWVNSLWPSDAIWRHRSGSTLVQVMAWCLTAPSHYLNQCWLIISEVLWHSTEGNFTWNAQDIYPWHEFENY